jgi:actin-related protein
MAEVCTVVVDVGSSCVKAGYAGDDIPSAIFPSVLQKYPFEIEYAEPIEFNSDSPHRPPVQRGDIKDWDQMEKFWNKIMDMIVITSSESVSVLLTESPRSTMAERHKWGELLFETFRVPSMCIGSSAPLCLFASG